MFIDDCTEKVKKIFRTILIVVVLVKVISKEDVFENLMNKTAGG